MTNISTITPTDFRDFLKARGWILLQEGLRDRLYVLESEKFPGRQLAYTLDPSMADFKDSITIALEKYSLLVGSSVEKVITSIRAVRDDVLRFRLASFERDDSIPLNFAASFINSTEKLLKTGACTATRPSIYYKRLSSVEANQIVNLSRFNHTEEGSFVISVNCPINSMDNQVSLDLTPEDSPFIRRVALILYHAIDSLTTAIEGDHLDSLVDQIKNEKTPLISANLCESLLNMHDEYLRNSLDFSISWAPIRPPIGKNLERKISILPEYFARIEEVRRELKSAEPESLGPFIGTVERLEGEIGDDGQRFGNVVLSILLPDQGETVMARAMLSAEDYKIAHMAHMTNGAYVKVSGRILPGRQPRQLRDLTNFEQFGG